MSLRNVNKSQYKVVIIGGSAGSFQVITKLLEELKPNFPLPIILCLHRLKHVRHGFVEALSIKSKKVIVEPNDKETLKKNLVYLAPANYHLGFEYGNKVFLSTEEMVNNSRPAIDITFETGAYVYGKRALGIMLSGANKDGALGMKRLVENGGLSIVQEPSECMMPTMPQAVLDITNVDAILKTNEIIKFLNSFC